MKLKLKKSVISKDTEIENIQKSSKIDIKRGSSAKSLLTRFKRNNKNKNPIG